MEIRNKINMRQRITMINSWTLLLITLGVECLLTNAQFQINRPPAFTPGGDMARFSISENTPVGSPVYQLQGYDPEGTVLHYSISGPVFSVDRDTGVVRLRQELDREKQDLHEVIISITDQGINGGDPNTVSLRREIPVRDFNDNAPMFIGRPYTTTISESTSVSSTIEVTPQILVTDKDSGVNSEITVNCMNDETNDSEACESFYITTEKISDGKYMAVLVLRKALDYETRSSYLLTLIARDGAITNSLSANATVTIQVIDVQDQVPVFINAPYSASVLENTRPGESILKIAAMDGDTGHPNPVKLTLENDKLEYFDLRYDEDIYNGMATLVTSQKPLDRENPMVLRNGGVYAFSVRATEIMKDGSSGDSTTSQITIVVKDVDDNFPEFNQNNFNISIPENLEFDTPLPGLGIVVTDRDLAENSVYNLVLKNIMNSEGVFSVVPSNGSGRTPVVVKVKDPSHLDYDVIDPNMRIFKFDVIATVHDKELSMTRVTVNLLDENDNSPVFNQSKYFVRVQENATVGTQIANISAIDKDSGLFSQITYKVKGFGSEYFRIDPVTGLLLVARPLDYETQKSFSLSLVALDGGDRETLANLMIELIDVNDNYPMFESLEYSRTIREGAISFEPQLYVKATDLDSSLRDGGVIKYAIESENSISGHVFKIDRDSGEITITKPVSSMDTERGQYELIVTASDQGSPSLRNTTRVLIRVGITGNQRPMFKGQITNIVRGEIPGPPSYKVTIPENAIPGSNVTMVTATDPDGVDGELHYRIVGAHDNFDIDETSGLIRLSPVAKLDRDTNPDLYSIVVNAVDDGVPIQETATTTVFVTIQDVNDKPPRFTQKSFAAYVSERAPIGSDVIQITANDTDLDANLIYSMIDPITARAKTGNELVNTKTFDYKNAFTIDEKTGIITVNKRLNHDLAAMIIITVQVRDLNAKFNIEEQIANAEVTIYVQSYQETNPIFLHKGWTPLKPVINIKIKEELPIDGVAFKLLAEDPVTEQKIQRFTLLKPDPMGLFKLNEATGEVILQKRLDYETLNNTNIVFTVRALSNDGIRHTINNVNVTVENVNDHSPVFDQKIYKIQLQENLNSSKPILTVKATDGDISRNNRDRMLGYHIVSYGLMGANADMFLINNETGAVSLAPFHKLDREVNPKIRVLATAHDSVGRRSESRTSTAEIVIDLLDLNDNAPMFSQKLYTAVIPENVQTDTLITQVNATDPDEGLGGEIHFDLMNEGDANGLLKINPENGEIRTKKPLTGKGRSDPYELVIRGTDSGGQLANQKSLYTDVNFILYIGDVSSNDGIPFFISPKIGQIAVVTENATIGSPVFQVIATDPDNPNTPSGTLRYSIQQDTEDANAFKIDANSGLISTTVDLDREIKSSYNLIVAVTDQGEPPQGAKIVLKINIMDIDDHEPKFARDIVAPPYELEALEEQPLDNILGSITAIDEDIDENGAIDYKIVDGNQEDIFEIVRLENNTALLKAKTRLDRETMENYLLTIKCFKLGTRLSIPDRMGYDRRDFSEMQVRIKLVDVDDNLPQFIDTNQTIGIRLNAPIDILITTVKAIDIDSNALPINYIMKNITFVPQFHKKKNSSLDYFFDLLVLNNVTGEIRSAGSLASFVDGFFELIIEANNTVEPRNKTSEHILKVYIIRDKSMLKFVFHKPPPDVRNYLNSFSYIMRSKLKKSHIELQLFEAQVLMREDHNLDFSSTSSCFQLMRNGTILTQNDMLKIMNNETMKNDLLDVYAKYSVSSVEPCSSRGTLAMANIINSSGTWLVILAIIIGIASLIATCTAYCLSKRYKTHVKTTSSQTIMPSPYSISGPSIMYTEPVYGPLHTEQSYH